MKKLIKWIKEFFNLKHYKGQFSNFCMMLFLLAALSSFKGEIRQQKEKTKQCKGVTKKGERCKRKIAITNTIDYCYQHLKQNK